jgi:hypothetical protein
MQEPEADRAFNPCRFGKFLETERWMILCDNDEGGGTRAIPSPIGIESWSPLANVARKEF